MLEARLGDERGRRSVDDARREAGRGAGGAARAGPRHPPGDPVRARARRRLSRRSWRRAPLPVDVRGRRSTSGCPRRSRPPPTSSIAEALTNVVRYAEAASAAVRVARRGGEVEVIVSDDGVGGAAIEGGTGLRGLTRPRRGARRAAGARQPARRGHARGGAHPVHARLAGGRGGGAGGPRTGDARAVPGPGDRGGLVRRVALLIALLALAGCGKTVAVRERRHRRAAATRRRRGRRPTRGRADCRSTRSGSSSSPTARRPTRSGRSSRRAPTTPPARPTWPIVLPRAGHGRPAGHEATGRAGGPRPPGRPRRLAARRHGRSARRSATPSGRDPGGDRSTRAATHYSRLGVLAHVGQPEYFAGVGAGERMAAAGVRHAACVDHEVGQRRPGRALRRVRRRHAPPTAARRRW